MMLGLVVGHCYLCWGKDRRLTHAVQIHAGLMFVCVSDLSIHRCGKCVQHLSKPLCCEDITSVVCVLSFFVLWEILSLRALSRCPLRHYAANSVMEVEQDLCSYTFLSSDTRICTVDQASQCWTLRQLRGTELKKNYTCIASPTSTSPSFLHHLQHGCANTFCCATFWCDQTC